MFAINTGKNVSNSMPPTRYDLECKYKLILCISNKIENQLRNAKSLNQLYSSNVLSLRQYLCNEIKIIFRYAPIEYGKFCEEILWKRNYYDYVMFYKNNQKNVSEKDLPMFRLHLTSGIGHYHSLILSFRKVYNLSILDDFICYLPSKPMPNVKLANIISNNIINLGYNDSKCNFVSSSKDDYEEDDIGNVIDEDDDEEDANEDFDLDYTQDENYKKTILFLCHRFFICIGDLTRYYVDFFSNRDHAIKSSEYRFKHHYFNISSFYYKSASMIQPQLGMPFNQLGTLYSGRFYGLDSLYYYFRCLNSKKTFTGIKKNIEQTFDLIRKQIAYKNQKPKQQGSNQNKYSNNFSGNINDSVDKNSPELVKKSILNLIDLFFEIYTTTNLLKDNNKLIKVSKVISKLNIAIDFFQLALDVKDNIKITSQSSPCCFSTEIMFKIVAILVILIEQVKVKFKQDSLKINFEAVKSLRSDDEIKNFEMKANFTLMFCYEFLFRIICALIQHESNELKRMFAKLNLLGSNNNKSYSQNLLDAFTLPPFDNNDAKNCDSKQDQKNLKKTKITKSDNKTLKPGNSFSSDFNDHCEDSSMMNQLKSTAIKSIVALFESSDNEVEDNSNSSNDADSDASLSNLMEKLIYSEDEDDDAYLKNGVDLNDKIDFNVFDSIMDSDVAPMSNNVSSNGLLKSSSKKLNENDRSSTMDQLLKLIYTDSNTPVIKFFCDYLQSNSDFLELLQHLDVLPNFFAIFVQYLNRLSEFDFSLLICFKTYISHCFAPVNEVPRKKLQDLLNLSAFIQKFSSNSVNDYSQKYPLTIEVDYLNISEELGIYFSQLFNLQSDHTKSCHQINLKLTLTNEQYGYICMRSILVFGVKMALLSLNSLSFKFSLLNYSPSTMHNLAFKKPAQFVFTRLESSNSSLFSSNHCSPNLISNDKNCKDQELIFFNDNQPETSSSKHLSKEKSNNFPVKIKSVMIDESNSNRISAKTAKSKHELNGFKSLKALEKLPYILIDPFVYMESLESIRTIVMQKEAFLIVPKLVTDFLNKLKEKNIPNAAEASMFLFNEFFRGSRMIRFIRNEDRVELEMSNYPRYRSQYHDDIKVNDDGKLCFNTCIAEDDQTKVEDMALFYVLLEHGHYLLSNKVLVNKFDSKDTNNANDSEQQSNNLRIILITNSLSKWGTAAPSIAKPYGIDIVTMDKFLEKPHLFSNSNANFKFKKSRNKRNKHKNPKSPAHQTKSSPYFKPINVPPKGETVVTIQHRHVT